MTTKRTIQTAQPYEVTIVTDAGGRETVEVYAYSAVDAAYEACVVFIGRGINPAALLSIAPPRRCWGVDASETSAVARIMQGIEVPGGGEA